MIMQFLFLFFSRRRYHEIFAQRTDRRKSGHRAGVVLLAPVVIPVIGTITKPLIKSVIKGALIAYEGAKVTLAEARESLEDITAEAKAEVSGDPAAKE